MAAGTRSTSYVDPAHERAPVGPHTGGRFTTASSWAYIDLSAYARSFVRVRVMTNDAYLCMVASSSVTPATATTTIANEDNQAEPYSAGEVDRWVIDPNFPVLAYKRNAGTDGEIFVRVE